MDTCLIWGGAHASVMSAVGFWIFIKQTSCSRLGLGGFGWEAMTEKEEEASLKQ